MMLHKKYEEKINQAKYNLLHKIYRMDPQLGIKTHIYEIDKVWQSVLA